ncbi:ribonuclease H family protein [Lactobacillus sp. ESL0791]|uniref:ribonuclease H family protein n=1 Tax=Lactobacillus sp. ESL0791 TaxID=2983234 RepID=UPI0023F63B1A|nr:ribonuclease H family protein [Lactobacillus sp. ESL0791]MDF7638140.1 ribonuclease H family protein [Lactobacillus sp. ESL0791]
MKFYAVKKGRIPGIYRSWDAAKKQVDGFSGAEYKSFSKITDATAYLDWDEQTQKKILQKGEDTLQNAIKKIQAESKRVKQPAAETSKRVNKKSKVINSSPGDYFAVTYTDGGTRNTGNYKGGHVRKTDKAAWAYLIEWNGQEVHGSGGEFGATNNKMEQTALIMALKKLLELGFNKQHLLFVLDSQYVLNAINKGWLKSWKRRGWKRGKGKLANVLEWQQLEQLLKQFPDSQFEWTKGHANNRGNEFVDHTLNVFMDQM